MVFHGEGEKGREREGSFIKDLSRKSSIQTTSNSHQLSTVIPLQWKQHESRRQTDLGEKTLPGIWHLKSFGNGLFPVMEALNLTLKGSLLQGLFCSLVL